MKKCKLRTELIRTENKMLEYEKLYRGEFDTEKKSLYKEKMYKLRDLVWCYQQKIDEQYEERI